MALPRSPVRCLADVRGVPLPRKPDPWISRVRAASAKPLPPHRGDLLVRPSSEVSRKSARGSVTTRHNGYKRASGTTAQRFEFGTFTCR
jgi:hypothetical protein